jgi:hypothetical protein
MINFIDILFLIIFLLILFVYMNYSKSIGLYLSIFTIFFSNFLIYVNNYGSLFMIKEVFISFTSLCIFSSIIYKCIAEPVNNILTWLVRLNIFILIFTVTNIFLQISLFFTTITTPYIIVKNSELKLSSTIITVTSWIILVTITLYWYYNDNIYFKNNNSFDLVLFSLFIPFIMHFYNNMYFESRAILLCLSLIFDVFNHNKSIFDITY